MGFLKGLGTVVCCIILFLALTVFSVAFLINSTVLNADFMNSQIDKLDFTAIAGDVIDEQFLQEIPQDAEFLSGVALKIIEAQEPLVKEQIHAGVKSAYSYLLEKDSELNITVSLVEIKRNLKASIWDAAVAYLHEQLAGMSVEQANLYVADMAAQIPAEVIPAELALLPADLRDTVIQQYLLELGGQGFFDSQSLGLDSLFEGQAKTAFEGYIDSYIDEIPDTYTLDENSIGQGVLDSLRQAKDVVNYFQTAYFWLIVIMVVVAGLIFLINWSNVRASLRALGIDLLIFGILDLAGILIVRNMQLQQYLPDTSSSIQSWINGLYHDITGIMLWFSIGVLVVGAVLLALSFVVKRREAAV